MTDSHCHLYELEEARWIGDRPDIIICPGGDLATSRKAVELAQKFDGVYAVVGQHPESNDDFDKEGFLCLTQKERVVAIGECGLDSDSDREISLFRKNYDLALETELPLVVHCRGVFGKVFEMLEYSKVQMHCFTGNMDQMWECARRGWYMSFGGILTFKKSVDLREVAKNVPDNLLLVETDSPYLSPEPIRGQVNKPGNVRIVCELLAKIRGVGVEEIERLTSENAKRLFLI
jgi:TatD DNase family protein